MELLEPQQSFAAGDKWPERSGETADWKGPDILFAGFEEIIPLNAVTVVAGGGMESINSWNVCLDCALNCKPLPQEYIAAQVRSACTNRPQSPTVQSDYDMLTQTTSLKHSQPPVAMRHEP